MFPLIRLTMLYIPLAADAVAANVDSVDGEDRYCFLNEQQGPTYSNDERVWAKREQRQDLPPFVEAAAARHDDAADADERHVGDVGVAVEAAAAVG